MEQKMYYNYRENANAIADDIRTLCVLTDSHLLVVVGIELGAEKLIVAPDAYSTLTDSHLLEVVVGI